MNYFIHFSIVLFAVQAQAANGTCELIDQADFPDSDCCNAFCEGCPAKVSSGEYASMEACVSDWSESSCRYIPSTTTEPPCPTPHTTTDAPVTTVPVTTAPVTTEPVTTDAPTTEAPTTQAPTTQAPTTQAPTTQATTTSAPETTSGQRQLCAEELCQECSATPGNNQNIGDAQCQSDCMDKGNTFWPCSSTDLCYCSKMGTTTTRGPATTAGPSGDDALDAAWAQIYPIIKNADYASNLFLSMKPTNQAQSCIGANKSQCRTSTVYVGQDFISAAEKMIKFGIDGKKLYIGEYKTADGALDPSWSPDAALMNLALFLGQAMEETILYDVCDENSWDRVHKVTGEPFDFKTMDWTDTNYLYPATNACGQLGQRYSDYTCDASEKKYECPQDMNMALTATTKAEWWGAPPALKCGPNLGKTNTWNFHSNGPEFCGAGKDQSCPNGAGDTELAGCCWWGRGVIQTTGRCNIGKLNYFLGAGGSADAPYPTVDLCKAPNLICEGPSDLKWLSGLYYWVDKVQVNLGPVPEYNVPAFNFNEELLAAVASKNSNNMAARCSGLVNRGCASGTQCEAGKVDKLEDRQASTTLAVEEFLGGNWQRRQLRGSLP